MKQIKILSVLTLLVLSGGVNAQSIFSKIKSKTTDRVNNKIDNAIDKELDKTEAGMKKPAKEGTGKNSQKTASMPAPVVSADAAIPQGVAQNIKAFQNYDFIPGDTVVFEDHFTDDQNGEFPAHWNLGAGQGVMNTVGEQRALLITEGNYAHISPLIKAPIWFGDAFTIEYDGFFNGGYGPHIYFYDNGMDAKKAQNDKGSVNVERSEVKVKVPSADLELLGSNPGDISDESNLNKWHHVAIGYKKNQLKVYIDQHRVLVVPNLGIAPHAFDIEGIGDGTTPIVIANLRVARGAGMNMLGKKFTDTKIITHGINFDVNKATIKPESMGTLNGIVQILKDNPEIKFEVGGHTDSDGDDALNNKLSQARAEAVRTQLIAMGIDAARLTAKGYGKSKPISDNNSLEGKANNRRVEFVKKV